MESNFTPHSEVQNRYPEAQATPVVSTGDWVVTILLLAIPIVNIIMALVWAFGGGANLNKRNYSRAFLIWILIGIGLYIVLGAATAAMFASFFG